MKTIRPSLWSAPLRNLGPLLLFLLFSAASLNAATYVNRRGQGGAVISVTLGSQAWRPENGPYVVESAVTIPTGERLDIAGGTVVQFNAGCLLRVEGSVNASGASFLRNADGRWAGIYLAPSSTNCVIENCQLEGSGSYMGYIEGANRYTAILVNQSSPRLTGNQIRNIDGHGILLISSAATITGNQFTDVGGNNYPIAFASLERFPAMGNNAHQGTGIHGIGVPGGTMAGTIVWNNPGTDLAYYLTDWLTLAEHSSWTLDPGVVCLSQGSGVKVEGTLTANGSASAHIRFAAQTPSVDGDQWSGLYFGADAGDSKLVYCEIQHAGAYMGYIRGANRYASVLLDGCSPSFSHVAIQYSSSVGVECFESTGAFADCSFLRCRSFAFLARAQSRPVLDRPSFEQNGAAGDYAVAQEANSVIIPTGASFLNNAYSGVRVLGGTIASSGVWKRWQAAAPYVVTDTTTIAGGVTLQIEPGTVVKLQGSALVCNGVLLAESDGEPISFTSYRDDNLGGDSNGDGAASTPVGNDWSGIYLSPNSGASSFRNFKVRYAGAYQGYINGANRYASVYVDSCSPSFVNGEVSESGHHGIELFSSTARLDSVHFSNMAGYPVIFDNLNAFPLLSGNSAEGSGIHGILVPGGTMSGTSRWNYPGTELAYVLDGDLGLAEGSAWQIDPGCVIKGSGVRVLVYGRLQALGTLAQPILFTSAQDSPAAGNWKGLYFGPASQGSHLSYCELSYAGTYLGYINGENRYTAIYVEAAPVAFDHLTVRDSSGQGLECWGSSPTVQDAVFQRNRGYALLARNQSWPVLARARLEKNGEAGRYTVGMDASSIVTPSEVVFDQNFYQGVENVGGTLGASGVWKNWSANAPYVITRDVTVASGVTLEIEQGSAVKFAGSGLYVNGTLLANGAEGQIRISSAKDDALAGDSNGDGNGSSPAAGDWKGIYLSPSSGASFFNNLDVAYAGSYLGYINGQNRYTAFYVESCSPTFTNVVIHNAQSAGLDLYSSRAAIVGSTFADCGGYPINFSTLDCFPVTANNVSLRNGQPGVHLAGGTITVSGSLSKPGEAFPYVVTDNLGVGAGAVVNVAAGVQFRLAGVGVYVNGSLLLNGTADAPIVFSPLADNPAPASWRGLYFGGAAASGSRVHHVEIRYAGSYQGYFSGANRYAALFLEQTDLSPDHLKIHDNDGNGIEFVGGSVTVHDSLIYRNAGAGIASLNGSTARLVNNSIYANKGGGIYLRNAACTAGNNLLLSNGSFGLRNDGSTGGLDYNCLFGNTAPQYVGAAAGAHDLQLDPGVIDAAGGQFELNAGSPCLDAGLTALCGSDWTDFADRLRVANGRVDIGAYESSSTPAVRAFDLLVRKPGESSYTGSGVYTVDQQTKTATTDTNSPAVYFLQGAYSGNIAGAIELEIALPPSGWSLRVIQTGTAGESDITAAVLQSGWILITNASPGAVFQYRLEAGPSANVAGLATYGLDVRAAVEGLAGVQDEVLCQTTNAVRYTLDLAIRRGSDVRFIGRDIVNANGAGQSRSETIGESGKAVFVIQARNAGNIPQVIALRAPPPGSWTVQAFEGPAGGGEITGGLLSGDGYSTPPLDPGHSGEIRVELSDPGAARDETMQLVVTGVARGQSQFSDSVRADVTLLKNQAAPASGLYTVSADFDQGTAVGTQFASPPDQIQLDQQNVTLPFIWVPNSNEGTVSKVDTRTGRELGRYRTGPDGSGNPSRTTVDLQGNCWLGNRHTGTAIKIGLYENGQYVDRNGNGQIETSMDKNGDGAISGDEILPWGQDECVLVEVVVVPGHEGAFVPGTYPGPYASDDNTPGPRGFALDSQNNLWLGTLGLPRFFKIDGDSGKILKVIDISSVDHTSYGAVIDSQGVVWSSGHSKNNLLRLDTKTETFSLISMPHFVYGLGLDQQGRLYASGWESAKLSKVDVTTSQILWTKDGPNQSRGVAVTGDGDIWVANSGPGTVTRWSSDGVIKATIAVGSVPTGVAVDADGKVWVVNDGDEYIHRIDPALNQIDLSKRIAGGLHYGYSDMTGIIARTTTTRVGAWTVTHNSRVAGAAWGVVRWTSSEPPGTSIRVQARSTGDFAAWSAWEIVTNGVALTATPSGQYLQVEVTLQAGLNESSPVLYDLAIAPASVDMRPELSIQAVANGGVEIAWAAGSGANWALYRALRWASPTSWVRVANTPTLRAGNFVVSLPAAESSEFYLLRR